MFYIFKTKQPSLQVSFGGYLCQPAVFSIDVYHTITDARKSYVPILAPKLNIFCRNLSCLYSYPYLAFLIQDSRCSAKPSHSWRYPITRANPAEERTRGKPRLCGLYHGVCGQWEATGAQSSLGSPGHSGSVWILSYNCREKCRSIC